MMYSDLRYITLLIIILSTINLTFGEDLYDVLEVSRSATQKEIKQSYKKLAREWHPDKNDDPNAADKFTKINEAYETLSDPEKRNQYDRFGYTAARDQQARHHGGFGGGRGFDPFEQFFNSFNHFGGFGGGDSIIDKHTINYRMYETRVLPDSLHKPSFLYVYADMCFECAYIEHIIERFIKELEGVGMGIGTFNAGVSRGLTSHLRITRVPTIMAVINGRVSYFRGDVSLSNLRDYIRNLFPSYLITKLSDDNYQDFLAGWHDNHVRAIFFGQRSDPSARLLAPAFQFRDYVKFGYVDTRSASSLNMMHRFNINRNRETFMMFNEEVNSSVASITMQQLPRSTLDEVIQSNKFLLLPRLSSQKHFEELCPAELKAKRKKLCIVLISKNSDEHEEYRDLFRKYVQKSSLSQHERVNFAYIYEETQHVFIQTLAKGDNSYLLQNNALKVAIIWRIERNHLSYEWLKNGWNFEETQMKESEVHLEKKVKELLNSDKSLAHTVNLPEFHNEHRLHLMRRILNRLIEWGENAYNYIFRYENTTMITILLSFCFLFGMSFFMSKMAALEEEEVKKNEPQKTKPRPPSRTLDNKIVHVYEMRYESYATLVSEADTGLTITLLVDDTVKDKLIQQFGEMMYPYSRYSGLSFAFVNLEEYIGWYRHLLEESVENRKQIPNINIHNCAGTVLAVNGYRKYYYIYHAKKVRKWMRNTNKVSSAIGFVETDDESEEEEKDMEKAIPSDKLLDGLEDWLDRVFDGSLRKIRVPFWPEMTLK